MGVLSASVALGYFTIAAVVAPRIRMPSVSSRLVLVVRAAAIAFFIGCGMTHVHIFVHTVGLGTPQPVELQPGGRDGGRRRRSVPRQASRRKHPRGGAVAPGVCRRNVCLRHT